MKSIGICGVVGAVVVGATALGFNQQAHQSGEKAAIRLTTWEVKMKGNTNTFDPPSLPDVKVGDSVTFINEGGTHTATSNDIKTGDPKKTFNTGTMKIGQRSVIYFNAAGTFEYECLYHNNMDGKITVSAP